MKFAFIDTYYNDFLEYFYKNNPESRKDSYNNNLKAILNYGFGTSDFYSYNLRKFGHITWDLLANDKILQQKWARENKLTIKYSNLLTKLQMQPFIYKILGKPEWIQKTILAQIKEYKPEIVYIQDLSILTIHTLQLLRKNCKLLVGQIASMFPSRSILSQYDLIITSFPHYIERLRSVGIKSEYLKIGFEKRILDQIGEKPRRYDVAFVGSFSPYHMKTVKVFEDAAKKIDIHVWGQGLKYLSPFSPLRKNYHGVAWGLDMYKILAQTKIVLNRHINVAEGFANNMRLYESTGMGAMLLTDDKKNLNELFIIDKEVVTYRNSADLIEKINYYLEDEDKRKTIADAGQKRTLDTHVYSIRMKELVRIINKYI